MSLSTTGVWYIPSLSRIFIMDPARRLSFTFGRGSQVVKAVNSEENVFVTRKGFVCTDVIDINKDYHKEALEWE